MLKLRTVALAAVIGLGVTTLAACSSDSEPEDSPTVESPAPEPVETSEAPEPEPTDEPADDDANDDPAATADGVTAPGATLSIGDTAVLPWDTHQSDDPVLLNVTAVQVREGNLDDLLALDFDDETKARLEGFTPYYVDYTMVKADQSQPEIAFGSAVNQIGARNPGGADIQDMTILFGTFDECDSSSFGREIDEGEVHESCSIFLVPGGQEFGSVIWTQSGTEYSKFDGEPVAWQ